MGKHFGVPVRCHELLMTEFERDYFNAIGVETPPHSDMSTPEEGLQDGEVAIFYMPRCTRDLVNIVMWANRKQMRKIVFIENDFAFAEKDELFEDYKGKHWKAIGAYEKKAETIPMRNLNLCYPQREGPFGYKGKIVRFTDSPFGKAIITSYSGEELEGAFEEKPLASSS
ncbi:hypothetical protein QR680_006647 [Steinernema hermaphroditum]|uniref:SRR1-like domain-containing protein n=1 Tax=Steinernema hermaphroditum TaxID=289476 RepID=A0AA39HW63_9BILA|nr:hypothetical protein QR680_006647 [Steinernema hermaphroditum]